METNTTEAADFREAQRRSWNNAATGWRTWADRMLEWTGHVSERLVDLAGVEAGSRVLDVAAGLGEPALTAARRTGPDGSVVATDISPEMLGYARERVAAAGVSNVEFLEREASKLEFPEASFDAAVSRWGIIFEPRPRPRPRASAAFSSPARGWRSRHGGHRPRCR